MPTRVLIVDDEPLILDLLKSLLRERGFSVVSASSGSEAIQKIAESTFDLVVTDLRMETPDAGFDVVRVAKSQSPQPAVVILTAFPIPVSEWRHSGADALVHKGTGIDRMLDDMEDVVKKRDRRKRA